MGFTTMGSDLMIKHSLVLLLAAAATHAGAQDAWWPRRASRELGAARRLPLTAEIERSGLAGAITTCRDEAPAGLRRLAGQRLAARRVCWLRERKPWPCLTIGNAPRWKT